MYKQKMRSVSSKYRVKISTILIYGTNNYNIFKTVYVKFTTFLKAILYFLL